MFTVLRCPGSTAASCCSRTARSPASAPWPASSPWTCPVTTNHSLVLGHVTRCQPITGHLGTPWNSLSTSSLPTVWLPWLLLWLTWWTNHSSVFGPVRAHLHPALCSPRPQDGPGVRRLWWWCYDVTIFITGPWLTSANQGSGVVLGPLVINQWLVAIFWVMTAW